MKEPPCPPDRKPHSERVKEIDDQLPEGKIAGVAIDNTPEHKEWYLAEIAKYPRLKVLGHCAMSKLIYIIRVQKESSAN